MADSNDLAGRTVIVTGANTGIGRVSAEALAKRGARVFLACRSEEKTRPVLEGIRAAGGDAEFMRLELADLDAVRASAQAFLDRGEKLHVLLNNAGLAGAKGTTKQGFELAFGTNHLGPFLFTKLLLPRLRESAPARIVNVASRGHYRASGIDWDALRRPSATATAFPEYCVSKLCNVLFTKARARPRRRRRALVLVAPGRRRVGRLARGALGPAPLHEALHADQRAGRPHANLVRLLARGRRP